MKSNRKRKGAPTQTAFSTPVLAGMPYLPSDGWQIGIDPKTGDCEVGPWPDREDWSRRYLFVIGHCSGWPMRAEDNVRVALRLGANRRKLEAELAKVEGHRPVAVNGCRPRHVLLSRLRPSTRALLRKKPHQIHDRSAVLCRVVRDMGEAGLSEKEILTLVKPLPWNKFAGRHNEEELLLAPLRRR